jgi:hypothetical protein
MSVVKLGAVSVEMAPNAFSGDSAAVGISFEQVAATLEVQTWTFARTMPKNPHEYTLRKTWTGDLPFEAVVQFIRDHGYRRRYGRRWYVCLDVGQHRYWTMGAPLPATILINRAVN